MTTSFVPTIEIPTMFQMAGERSDTLYFEKAQALIDRYGGWDDPNVVDQIAARLRASTTADQIADVIGETSYEVGAGLGMAVQRLLAVAYVAHAVARRQDDYARTTGLRLQHRLHRAAEMFGVRFR